MKKQEYKKSLVLIPSAYNSRSMGDIEHFIDFYKDKFDLYIIWNKPKKIENGVTYINNKSKKALYYVMTADYIIDAGSVNGYSKVNNSQKRISVWHGIPYKKMFIDLDPANIGYALDYDYGTDLMISPSKFYTEKFLRDSMLYTGEVLETGVSRTDSLFLSDKEKESLKEKLNIPKDKKILLYAPTFREAGKTSLPFNPRKLKEAIEKDGNDWVIVTKMHYLNTLKNKDNIIDCTNYPYVNNLLAIADLMITDYSSLFFDYSILNKPALFYQYDKDEYFDDRGVMFNLTDYVEKKYIIFDEEKLYKTLEKNDNKPNLEKIRKEFYPHQKEGVTKELVKKLNLNTDTRKTKEIVFLTNELNQMGGVHNFIMNFAKYFKENYNSRIIVIGNKEFADSLDKPYVFDKDNLIDIKLSYELNSHQVETILKGTKGYIISCQFSAHRKFEQFLKNKNVFLMFHGNAYDVVSGNYYKWHLKALNHKNLYNYKELLMLTDRYQEAMKTSLKGSLKDKVNYIENSIDFSDRKDYYKKNNEFAFISRLDDDKNIFDLLKIFSNENINKNYKVHVYGDGKLKDKFIEEIKRLNLDKKVILHGYVDNKDLMYKDKQGLIMTSISEGFPLTILEATKYGIPVFAYDSAIAVTEFEKNSAINIVKKSDIDDYISKLNNPNKFTKKDFDRIVNLYSNKTIFERWLKLFDEIEDKKNVKPSFISFFKIKVKDEMNMIKTKIKRRVKRDLYKALKPNFRNKLRTKLKYIIDRVKLVFFRIRHAFDKKPLVSLIVPFYNNNHTIEALLKSLRHNGYKNYEVLLINDGSKDDPTEIINKYNKNKKIKYFYKENEGLGLTRNFGIENANGKYLFFIDSDDTMYKGTLNYMVNFAEKNNLALVAGRCQRIKVINGRRAYWFKNIYKKDYVNDLSKRYLMFPDTLSTNKLYRVEDLRKSNIRFETGLYEDKLFSAALYEYYERIGIIKHIVYNWLVYGDSTSITTTYTYKNVEGRVDKMKRIYEMSNDKYKREHVKVFINHDFTLFINHYTKFSEEDQKKCFKLYYDFFKSIEDRIYLKDVFYISKKEVLKSLLDNDFKRFDKLATCLSLLEEERVKKLEERENENK